MKKRKLIARIKGGLGNQLFCYVAARRLALANDAELVIDDVTGFARDRRYRREYALDNFCIPARKATAQERMEPFERYRRGIAKLVARCRPFHDREYIEEEGAAFDSRLLELRIKRSIYLDGLWQDERYFRDVESVIRQDLRILPPKDTRNQEVASQIAECTATAVHMRWFSRIGTVSTQNVARSYYLRALKYFVDRVSAPHFFLFSDDPAASRSIVHFPREMVTCIDHNSNAKNAYADLWLMTKCKHFIIANSTFSWWGAWLAESESKIVIAPDMRSSGVGEANFFAPLSDKWVAI